MSLGYVTLVLMLYVLAVARVVRFVNHDSLLDSVRIAVARRERDDARSDAERRRWGVLAEFLACPWCVSIWVAGGTAVIPVVVVGWPLWWWPMIGLATSHLVGVAAPLSADDEIAIESG